MAKLNRKFLANILTIVAITILGYFLVRRVVEGFAGEKSYYFPNFPTTARIPAADIKALGDNLQEIQFSTWNPTSKTWNVIPSTASAIDGTASAINFVIGNRRLRKSNALGTINPNTMVKMPVSVNDATLAQGITITNLSAGNLGAIPTSGDPANNNAKLKITLVSK